MNWSVQTAKSLFIYFFKTRLTRLILAVKHKFVFVRMAWSFNWKVLFLPSLGHQTILWTALLSTGFQFLGHNVPLIHPQTRHQSMASCWDDVVCTVCCVCVPSRSVGLAFVSVTLLPQVIDRCVTVCTQTTFILVFSSRKHGRRPEFILDFQKAAVDVSNLNYFRQTSEPFIYTVCDIHDIF